MRRTLMIITVALVLCLCGCSEVPQISDIPTEPSQSESLPIIDSEEISQETDAPQSSVNIDTPEESGIASETIVLALEYHDLSDKQCKALLKSPSPLADVFKDFEKRETDHMENIRDTIECRANAIIRQDFIREQRESR